MNTPRIAFFPGSFDPITKGHVALVERAAKLFDEIVVGVGINTSKAGLYSKEQKESFVRLSLAHISNVQVINYQGLTTKAAMKNNAQFLLRGLRNPIDFTYEMNIEQMNKTMEPNLETVFLFTNAEYTAINSNIVREIIKSGGDVSPFVPKPILHLL
ncbi:MAG: pantetheine-phosphate adenylyltransferase [Luteibaculaceae bacterium]|jgi:pantetheine-phosphate adenylyltransferase